MPKQNSSRDNAKLLDPQRFQVAKSMSAVPGGPSNNNPMNTDVGHQISSISGVNLNVNGDVGYKAPPQLGGVYPNQPSGLPQGLAFGQRLNGGVPYGGQKQPSNKEADMLEAFRLGKEAQDRGGVVSPMGMIGQPPMNPPIPMQTLSTLDVTGWPSAEDAVGGKSKSGMNTKTGKR